MRSIAGPLAFAAALFLLAACVTAPNTPLDKAQQLSSIAVATPDVPERAFIFQAASGQKAAVALAGVLGGIAIAAVQADRQGKFKLMAEAHGFSARDALSEALVKAMPQSAAPSQITVERAKRGYLRSLPSQITADTLLDVTVTAYGYSEAHGDTVWRPTIALRCRLVRPSDGKVLMESAIESNAFPRTKGATKLTPLDDYSFKTFDAILADPDRALAGLREEFAVASAAIAAKLQ